MDQAATQVHVALKKITRESLVANNALKNYGQDLPSSRLRRISPIRKLSLAGSGLVPGFYCLQSRAVLTFPTGVMYF